PNSGLFMVNSTLPHCLGPVHVLFLAPAAPPRLWMQGASRSRAGGPARSCDAPDAALKGRFFGQGIQRHALLHALPRRQLERRRALGLPLPAVLRTPWKEREQ